MYRIPLLLGLGVVGALSIARWGLPQNLWITILTGMTYLLAVILSIFRHKDHYWWDAQSRSHEVSKNILNAKIAKGKVEQEKVEMEGEFNAFLKNQSKQDANDHLEQHNSLKKREAALLKKIEGINEHYSVIKSQGHNAIVSGFNAANNN